MLRMQLHHAHHQPNEGKSKTILIWTVSQRRNLRDDNFKRREKKRRKITLITASVSVSHRWFTANAKSRFCKHFAVVYEYSVRTLDACEDWVLMNSKSGWWAVCVFLPQGNGTASSPSPIHHRSSSSWTIMRRIALVHFLFRANYYFFQAKWSVCSRHSCAWTIINNRIYNPRKKVNISVPYR